MGASPRFALLFAVVALACGHSSGAGSEAVPQDAGVDGEMTADLAGPAADATTPDAGPGPDGAAGACGGGSPRFAVPLDTRDCPDRIAAPCPDAVSERWQLGQVLSQILDQCRGGAPEIWLRVSFQMGCPTQFELGGPSAGQMAADCLTQAFARQRWQCALALDCSYAERSTLP